MGWPAKKKSVREWEQDTLMLSVSLGRCCMTSFDVSNLPGRQTRVCGRQSSFSMCGSSLTAPPFPSLSLNLSLFVFFCSLLFAFVSFTRTVDSRIEMICQRAKHCRQSPSANCPSSCLTAWLSDRNVCLLVCLSVCLCLSVNLHFYPCCGSDMSYDLVQLQVHKQQFAWDYNWKAMVDSSWYMKDI